MTWTRDCDYLRGGRNESSFATLAAIPLLILAFGFPTHAIAAVAIFDGFSDADKNNNGVPLESIDVDVSGAGDGAIAPYIALGNNGSPAVYPMDTMVPEVTAVLDADDVGIKWYSISGFTTGGTPPSYDPRVSVHIIDDTTANLPDTNPSIGYNHSAVGGNRVAAAINSGLALAAEGKGRANHFAGFFGETISLGPEVGDAVEVSFDFRVWLSAPNLNTEFEINHIPAIGELRFGLYQDTDNQLGTSNPIAGRPDLMTGAVGPGVWGAENGNFRGDVGDINAAGAQGDHGWFVRLPIDDAENPSFDQPAGGADARINEELNTGSASDRRIMNGATDFVARPDSTDPQFVNLDIDRVYNVSLKLERFDDPDSAGNTGDTIMATVTVTDRATNQQFVFGDYEPVMGATAADGFSSDSWDYFGMGSAGATDSDDFDWLIDNFTVEVFGSNEPGGDDADFDGDGDVDGRDFLTWQRGLGLTGQPNKSTGDANGNGTVDAADLAVWRAQFGDAPGIGAIPEPASGLLATAAWIAVMAGRQRRRSTVS